ncbi:hypothetical protein EJM73_19450 [Clostridium botulinum]|uniref:hypothetical protein n=1 Tax=Clostridium botulinum TaxID=1491 RepID=UPI00137625F8|nr:hypothetical protein [Clostridium botulinum]NCI22172.1 hypothetical protein [Clostridium botulinum]NCI37788.1 hypothetical protein [Clostridium botulinum]NCI74434.1 hypothetical protein [Clostridium botulinum]NDI40909.1 hypothetical protein [Clostridium botulinum]NFA13535.1 hypothetical protein [Clostridium botulinum]
MSQETENIKLFKYDKETDDFNTTTFNITQALNNNWDKIDSKYEDTTKELTEIKETNEKQQIDINKIMSRLTFMTCRRSEKTSSGLFKQVRWYDEDNKLYALSDVSGDTSGDDFKPKNLSFHFYKDGNVIESYIFNLIFDEDDDLIRMELIKHA